MTVTDALMLFVVANNVVRSSLSEEVYELFIPCDSGTVPSDTAVAVFTLKFHIRFAVPRLTSKSCDKVNHTN